MEIIRSEKPKENAGQALSEILFRNINRPVLLMLSGGSALTILENVELNFLKENITVTMLDERCSDNSKINNFLQLKKTKFFDQGVIQGLKSISTEVFINDVCVDVEKRWETDLRNWKEKNINGVIISVVGIGGDGHVAGIIAGDYGVDFGGDKWVVSYTLPETVNEFTKRITTTYSFLRRCVDETIVYAVGKQKQIFIKKLEENVCDIKTTPVCILKEMKSVKLFTNKLE